MKLTVVIPTYNEAENMPRMIQVLMALPLPLTLLVVDDNSRDGTAEIVEKLGFEHPSRIQVLRRSGKLGLGTAYLAGFQAAIDHGAEGIAQMDADFSHPPEKLLDLYQALQTFDVAMGSRYVPGGGVDRHWPAWRKGLSAFGNLYARIILGLPIKDTTGGFRMWRRETLLGMGFHRVRSNGYAFQVEMAYLACLHGYRFVELPFYFADRRWGESKMSWRIQREAALRVWQLRWEYRRFWKSQNPQFIP